MVHCSPEMGSPSTGTEDIPFESVPAADANLPKEEFDEEKVGKDDGNRNSDAIETGIEDEDEEEDVDFNPFLKDTPSQEASSSLSSEIEGLDADVVDSGVDRYRADSSGFLIGDAEYGEEIVTQTTPSSNGATSLDMETLSSERVDEGKFQSTSQHGIRALHEKISFLNVDDEDAICKRTRARYSLARFTLDELETFLQETDDEDDIQNFDDEEEYKKFLAAVLLGGDGDPQDPQGNETVDDEDDDNDADFELEIEEALESDLDERAKLENTDRGCQAVGRRHRSRRNRLQKSPVQHGNKLAPTSIRPLRPLIPYMPIGHFPAVEGRGLMLKQPPHCPTPLTNGLINGFTPHQIGQLHCLIHEHVQLLIQVFSICALDPARRHIASNVEKMMSEMVSKRDQVLEWRRVPHSSFCFVPPYVHPTVSDDHLKSLSCQPPSQDTVVPHNGAQSSCWAPYISGPIFSIMDVAPLKLAEKYMVEVAAVTKMRQKIELGVSADNRFEREPLFPLSGTLQSSSGCDKLPKKTMAAVLVEKAKQQSVAPVPKEIAKLASMFYPLFNPALYPHKPPPAAVANRVLFTDSEDELLALGLMEFNTNWKAIQQRFLPCKTKHQIFVRQKNRSSSKAPENAIKAVRRLKSSPLTADEIARIEEGLKVFKLDWMSIWKFIVPYRDPTLLPRQWRIATGTQKSYKSDETRKAKRRVYELRRRMCKTAAVAGWHTSSEKEDHSADNAGEGINSGDNHTDREDEAYVHEAFLADWRPGTSGIPHAVPDHVAECDLTNPPCHKDSQVSVQMNISDSGGARPAAAALRSSSCQLSLRPYRARRNNNAHQVKLAPDLPPVNLPPSVRIMSQSAFKNYQAGTSRTSLGADCHIVVPAIEGDNLKSTSTVKSGISDPSRAEQNRKYLGETNTSHQYSHVSGVAKDKSGLEDTDESGPQLHPLLFQAPDAGHLFYPPLNCNVSTSSSGFSFSSGRQAQLNLSLFPNFRRARHTVNFLDKYLRRNETVSSPGDDFHPLLQKDNDVNTELVDRQAAAQFCANSESPRHRSTQNHNQVGASTDNPGSKQSPRGAAAKPSTPLEKNSELDLDIHLSFTSRKQKAAGSRDLNQSKRSTPMSITSDSTPVEPQNTKILSDQHCRKNLAFHVPGQALVLFGNDDFRNSAVISRDQSLPGIVMEQEELSDSEEELGENVMFECEEMTDSEGEEASDIESKHSFPNEVEKTSSAAGSEHSEALTLNVQGSTSELIEGHVDGMWQINEVPASPCLNSNSCPPASSPLMKRKYAGMEHSSDSGDKRHFSQSAQSKEPSTTGQKHAMVVSEQPLDSSRNPPRKRREGSSLSPGRSRVRSASLDVDIDVQSPKLVNKDEHDGL